MDFFYADRGEVRLKPGRTLPAGAMPLTVKTVADNGTLRLTLDPQGLKGAAAFGLVDLLAGLTQATDTVESASLTHVDWRHEVEQIKANSSR